MSDSDGPKKVISGVTKKEFISRITEGSYKKGGLNAPRNPKDRKPIDLSKRPIPKGQGEPAAKPDQKKPEN